MEITHIDGKHVGDILLYTLSTCVWCRRMKAWLDERGIEYRYVDVDLQSPADRETAMDDVRRWNPQCSFPTVVVNGVDCFVGFRPDTLQELLDR